MILDGNPGPLEKRALPLVSLGERCNMIKVCDVIYGHKRGAEICAFLEAAMGQPCPCKQGTPCPLMPRSLSPLEEGEILAPALPV